MTLNDPRSIPCGGPHFFEEGLCVAKGDKAILGLGKGEGGEGQ